MHTSRSVQFGLGTLLLAGALTLGGCKSDGEDVTAGDRPVDGDGSRVIDQMQAANEPRAEMRAEARMENKAGAAANKQLAEQPPAAQTPAPAPTPAPAQTVTATPANTESAPAAKPEAKAEAPAKAEAKAEPKAEPKPAVTFLNCDKATAISTKTLDNGLVIEELKLGEGAEAKPGATVTINYHGTLKENGTMFDTTRGKQPATFPLNRLIKGWQQGVPGMKPGGIRRLTIPYALAYGEAGRPPVIPPKSDLVFIIELVQVVEPSK